MGGEVFSHCTICWYNYYEISRLLELDECVYDRNENTFLDVKYIRLNVILRKTQL